MQCKSMKWSYLVVDHHSIKSLWHFTCLGFQASVRKMWRETTLLSERCRRPCWASSAQTLFSLDMACKQTSVPWRWLLQAFSNIIDYFISCTASFTTFVLQSWLNCPSQVIIKVLEFRSWFMNVFVTNRTFSHTELFFWWSFSNTVHVITYLFFWMPCFLSLAFIRDF